MVAKTDTTQLAALMETAFWLQRWQNNELGFQLDETHPLLQQLLPQLIANHDKILVPLCGKSPDLRYLSQAIAVTGVELSAIACRDFFQEQRLDYIVTEVDSFSCYRSDNIALWQGDFFSFSATELADCRLAYDRAALIALPEPMRQRYASKLQQLLPAGSTILLISLEYPQHEKQGPPFSVDQAEIKALFPQAEVELLAEIDLTGKGFARRRFVTSVLLEKAYRITLASN